MSSLVKQCEERLAGMACRRGGVLASRATVGLAAVLRALGLPRGSGVLLPVMLCANVVHAVRGAGLEPLFVDMEVGEFGFGMDLTKAEALAAQRKDVRALLAVPLFGGGVDVEGLAHLAARHGLVTVEDAAQSAIRSASRGTRIDSLVTVHSFGPGKIGDASNAEWGMGNAEYPNAEWGMRHAESRPNTDILTEGNPVHSQFAIPHSPGAVVLSDNPDLLQRVRGELKGKRDLSDAAGRIMRSLDALPGELEGRQRMSEHYRDRLRIEGVEHPDGELPLWKYSVLVSDRVERDRVTLRLLERGVAAGNLYPPLARWFGRYQDGGREEFPVAWDISERIINLPLWPLDERSAIGYQGSQAHSAFAMRRKHR